MKTKTLKIWMSVSALMCQVALRAFARRRTAIIILSILAAASLAVSSASADNTVSVGTYVPVTECDTAITNNGVAYETCSSETDQGTAQASAYAFYGTNQTGVACNLTDLDTSGDGYALAGSEWSDTLVINAQCPSAGALLRFNFHCDGVGGGGIWYISSSAGQSYTDMLPTATGRFPYTIYFTNGIPFSMDVYEYMQVFEGNANVELSLTGILLPDGASITSLSGINWLTNVTIIHPSLSISQSGTNVLLHWFAFNANNFMLETTTNLADPSAWSPVTDYAPVQAADTEFTLNYPMDAPARFFRLIVSDLDVD